MFQIRCIFAALSVIFCCYSIFPHCSYASEFKVLVVMSYEEDFPWCQNIKEGIESRLGDVCEIKYFYMNTKKNFKAGEQKAEEAYAFYQSYQPDGVIAADDNAQSLFVLPFLKNKVKIPVMFCGVNAEPEQYGYPAENISGILERYHINESIAFAQQLVPSIRTVGFMGKDSPTARAGLNQVQKEYKTYPAEYIDFLMPKTIKELKTMTADLRTRCDALLLLTVKGITREESPPLEDRDGIPAVARIFGKPVIGVSAFQADYGVLCTVINTGQEQGGTAAAMLLDAMHGKPVSEIPVTRNHTGMRIINATVMKTLKIKPKPEILRGAKLVKTKKQL